MRSVETQGGTIDSAISRALEVLGAAREAVHVDILEGDSPGVPWIGRRKAGARATIEQWLAVEAVIGRKVELLQGEAGIAARSVGQGFYRKQILTSEGGREVGGRQAR